jgi:hypothetical protein
MKARDWRITVANFRSAKMLLVSAKKVSSPKTANSPHTEIHSKVINQLILIDEAFSIDD